MNALENLHNKSPEELAEIVRQLHGEINAKDKEISERDSVISAHKTAIHECHQVIESLRHQLNHALRHRFGQKSEKENINSSFFI